MPKRYYVIAVACYLAIPAILIAGAGLFRLIDPEMARGHSDYVRDYRLLELVQMGALIVAAGLAMVLWASTCYLVLKSRQRSLGWLSLGAAGPFGLMFIAMLEDRSPAADDLYQKFIRKLKIYWRVPLEVSVFVYVCFLAYESVVLQRELMISFGSFSTGASYNDHRQTQRIQRHGGVWRRAGNDLLGHTNLSALTHILQSCRPMLQAANQSNSPRSEALQ